MTPYVQREIFRAWDQKVFRTAERLVSFVPEAFSAAVRCHELARAVYLLLDIAACRIVDGKCGAVEHSWLSLAVPIAHSELVHYGRLGHEQTPKPDCYYGYREAIIDVYTPGRLPQVQLIHVFPLLKPTYVEGSPRNDINVSMVEELRLVMREKLLASYG